MAKAYGFNILFDPKLKEDRLSIELNDLTAEQSLEMVMQAAAHFYKVLDEHTIIVVDDTPQNRREYEDLVIKTFFLSNADVKDVDKLLRSLIEARRLSTNEQLNAITLRDTADKVAIAEKLIAVNDKAKAEVLVDVELLLMSSRNDSNLGAALSSYTFNLGLDTAAVSGTDGQDGSLYLDQIKDISRGNWFINIPSVVINLAISSGNAEVLAQPQLRITEGEKASLLIGDRVPIPVTSFNTGYQGAPGSVTPITSFQYQDIGIKIDVEPRVHHNREVTLKLTVEVSNLGEEVSVGPNQTAVTIGTRTITSVIRLAERRIESARRSDPPRSGRGHHQDAAAVGHPAHRPALHQQGEDRSPDRSGADPHSLDHPVPGHHRSGSRSHVGGHREPDLVLRFEIAADRIGTGAGRAL